MNMFTRLRYYLLVMLALQILSNSCSRHLYRISDFGNIETGAERRMLSEFLESDTGKLLNTGSTAPSEIIATALEFLGVPHCMGGPTSRCMDCSGLLVAVIASYDIHLPHNSQEQARYGRIIAGMDELIAGDLVFFVRSYRTNRLITHSGIYSGDGRFIHTSTSSGVTVTSMNDPWWNERFVFGTRIFE